MSGRPSDFRLLERSSFALLMSSPADVRLSLVGLLWRSWPSDVIDADQSLNAEQNPLAQSVADDVASLVVVPSVVVELVVVVELPPPPPQPAASGTATASTAIGTA